MLLSLEILQSFKRSTQFSHAEDNIPAGVKRVCCGFGGVRGPIMFHNDQSANWREHVISCREIAYSRTSMAYNDDKEETK